ncbi:MAG TPA: DUF72 domain-containing protein [Terriglobales bacterium]|jgi:uncharacterized protein YecE (DUF72 family)|nr:DUF72 domain-containing protein [Terriglobales bacterium]
MKSTHQPSLFPLDKSDETVAPATPQEITRPFEISGILLGTSSFTATGWQGSFYPQGMRSRDFLSYYASQFQTVEIDSTFYGTPSASTVKSWDEKTPADFIFAVKVPQIITHDKVLVGCEPEFDEFIERMSLLGDKLGPMVFQFPSFDRWKVPKQESFLAVLTPFLKKLPADHKFVIEIRNKTWLDARFAEMLREHNVALAMTDTTFVPRPWEMKEKFDMITADFAYVRWLGDRHEIEKITQTWEKTVVDRADDLKHWVDVLRKLVLNKKIRKIFAFSNNHYAGHGPATVKQFWDLWQKK